MWMLPTHRQLVEARGRPLSERHWQILLEVIACMTDSGMDVEHAGLLLNQAMAVLALSTASRGSEPKMPAPHVDQLERLGLS